MENPEDDAFAVNTNDFLKSAKRKFDEDGFVRPSTPDIPKSSQQFVDNTSLGKYSGMDFFQSSDNIFSQQGTESVSVYFQEASGTDTASYDEKCDNLTQQTDNNFEQYQQSGDVSYYNNADNDISLDNSSALTKGDEAILSTSYTTSSLPNEEGAATQEDSENLLKSLFKDFEQEASAVFANWSKTFSQCGEYESKCQQRLDELIGNANSIEENLNTKKDILCNRLKGIGQTLET